MFAGIGDVFDLVCTFASYTMTKFLLVLGLVGHLDGLMKQLRAGFEGVDGMKRETIAVDVSLSDSMDSEDGCHP